MPMNKQKYHLICYDIANPRRLGRIHRYLKKHACPIQYSVFLYYGTHNELKAIYLELADMIEEKEDDIRFYTLPEKADVVSIGVQGLGQGIQLLDGQNSDYLKLI